jgi:hypothetical protein
MTKRGVLTTIGGLFTAFIVIGAIGSSQTPVASKIASSPAVLSANTASATPTVTVTPSVVPSASPVTTITPNKVVAAPVRTPTPVPASVPTSSTGGDGYTNSDGNYVPSPTQADVAPAGATAQCRDGSYSFSQHRSGTCSYHGGVANWL